MKKFQLLDNSLFVFSNSDNNFCWVGAYKDVSLKQAIPIDNGTYCIILLDPDSSKDFVYENLLCIDVYGYKLWSAKLASKPDVFVNVQLTEQGLIGKTWSGLNILIDRANGQELKLIFVK